MKLIELLSKYGDIEITKEQEKELKDKLGIKESKSWKPKVGEIYWFIGEYGANKAVWNGDTGIDKFRYSIGNCFKTLEEAEFAVEKLMVIAELKRFAEEHNECEIDWKDKQQEKHSIYYRVNEQRVSNDWTYTYRDNNVHFTSEEIAKQAIEEIGEDRLKKYYFEVEE